MTGFGGGNVCKCDTRRGLCVLSSLAGLLHICHHRGSSPGGPLALEEGKIQGADLNPTHSLGADPDSTDQHPDVPQTQEQEESAV